MLSTMLTLYACAKVNLTIEVMRRREDGYHEIASVLQAINLADVLTFQPAANVKFVCNNTGGIKFELVEETVLEAVKLLREATNCTQGAIIGLETIGVPRAAGLGSSADIPATVLKGLNHIWSLGLSLQELSRLASRLGSDVPFFIGDGTALAEGRGERITPLPSPPITWLVLLKPTIDIGPSKNATLYQALNPSHFTSGTRTQALVSSLREGKPLHPSMLYNVFENVAFDLFPQLKQYRQRFVEAGAREVHLAGSGPALFTFVPGKEHGKRLVSQLKTGGFEAYLIHTVW